MKTSTLSIAALLLAASPAFADGDAAAGENDFKKCKSCHTIASADEVFVKGGRTGPNLYGVIGRAAGAEDFKYSADMIAAGEGGLVWTEEELVKYVADPTGYLREVTGNSSARSKMTFKLADGDDVAAYLATFSDEDES